MNWNFIQPLIQSSPALPGLLYFLLGAAPLSAADTQDLELAARLLQRGQKALVSGDRKEALERFATVTKKYPASEYSAMALWEMYRIHLSLNEPLEAFGVLETLATRQPGHFTRAQEEQLLLVKRQLGMAKDERRSLEPVKKGDLLLVDDLLGMLAKIILSGPHSEEGIQAHYLLGVALEKADRVEEAQARHEEFVETYPRHELADDAGYQVADIAFKKWKKMRGAVSPKDRERAAVLLTWFLTRFPESDKGAQARAGLAEVLVAEERELRVLAQYYEGQGNEKAAAVYYRQLALKFPKLLQEGSPLRDKIRMAIEAENAPSEVTEKVGPQVPDGPLRQDRPREIR
ncbi:outer membrane lipoprotein YfiO [Prosthecobacter fusiformis]|uniref:Outer membrane lipoprotein YfiO n=1 Tax=Prosthecobacter fusiformis TaxID=48464 RepID=A0A4R7SQG0_9BACT|nr:outer membrane protein assembly factor BamD [Prosthecobacter fusiformis]TDU80829.1 outer membrane lipoprotein YfiO [Prosthecobacter fusiformis]